jgi:hypothetical protein
VQQRAGGHLLGPAVRDLSVMTAAACVRKVRLGKGAGCLYCPTIQSAAAAAAAGAAGGAAGAAAAVSRRPSYRASSQGCFSNLSSSA